MYIHEFVLHNGKIAGNSSTDIHGAVFAHPHRATGGAGKVAILAAGAVGSDVGVGVPLPYHAADFILVEFLNIGNCMENACFITCRYFCVESALLQNGIKHFEEVALRTCAEMATLLAETYSPIFGLRLIEWLQRAELNPVGVLVVLAHINEIVGKSLVVFGLQVVVLHCWSAGAAAAHGHPPRCRIGESLKNSIGALFLDFQHHAAL